MGWEDVADRCNEGLAASLERKGDLEAADRKPIWTGLAASVVSTRHMRQVAISKVLKDAVVAGMVLACDWGRAIEANSFCADRGRVFPW